MMATTNASNVRLYESWVKDHSQALYRVAYRLCGQKDLAEDLTQETFCEAWKSLHQLEDAAKSKAWLLQILRHRWSHYLRNRSRRIRVTANHDVAATVASPDPVNRLDDSDLLRNALHHVAAPLKAPLILVMVEGYTCSETACALGIPLGTVLSRIHRAKAIIRHYLQGAAELERPVLRG